MKTFATIATTATLLMLGAAQAGTARAADADLCEPARLAGTARAASGEDAARLHLAQGGEGMMRRPMMGQGGGHGPGMGMMRGHGMGMGMGRGGMGRGKGNPVRHRYVMMGPGIPASYASLTNPLKPTADNIAAGRKLYEENCASCHGAKGQGDGEAGRNLKPKPANLAYVIDKPIATDGFLMWTITEGGERLKTDMPAFRETLSEKQRWQLILFLRNGLR